MSIFNKNRQNQPFDQMVVNAVWEKAKQVAGHSPSILRQDTCGSYIKKNEYGQTSEYGWEIDHIYPISKGGSDELSNLQPLYWENNRSKGDNYPNWYCAV